MSRRPLYDDDDVVTGNTALGRLLGGMCALIIVCAFGVLMLHDSFQALEKRVAKIEHTQQGGAK